MKRSERIGFAALFVGGLCAAGLYWLLPGGPWWAYLLVALFAAGVLYGEWIKTAAREAIVDQGENGAAGAAPSKPKEWAQTAVALLLIGAAVWGGFTLWGAGASVDRPSSRCGGTVSGRSAVVEQTQATCRWAFTVPKVEIACERGTRSGAPAVTVRAGGRTHPLNGVASSLAVKEGWRPLEDIWLPDGIGRVSINPWIAAALELCPE